MDNKIQEIEYVTLNVAKSGIQRKEFFDWAMNHKLYKVDNQTSFNSRMRAVYLGKCPTEDLTAIIAIHENKPVAMCLCENTNRTTQLFKNDIKEKVSLNAKTQVVGFLSFFVKEKYRKKGIANKLMSQIEVARMPVVLGQLKENEYPIMVFEAREKAIDIIKRSKHSYQINCDRHHSSYREKMDIFSKHMEAIKTNNMNSFYYSNPLVHTKKEPPTIENFESNAQKPIRMKELLEKTPMLLIEDEAIKVVKKLPTLKPRVL